VQPPLSLSKKAHISPHKGGEMRPAAIRKGRVLYRRAPPLERIEISTPAGGDKGLCPLTSQAFEKA